MVSGDTPVDRPNILKADSQGNIHLAWAGTGGVFYRRWSEGQGWQPVVSLTEAWDRPRCDGIGLAVDSAGRVTLAWQGYEEIFYAREGGEAEWQVTSLRSGGLCTWARVPVVAIGGDGLIHLVWSRENGDDDDLYYGSLAPVPLP
jgi:hypothetical protein